MAVAESAPLLIVVGQGQDYIFALPNLDKSILYQSKYLLFKKFPVAHTFSIKRCNSTKSRVLSNPVAVKQINMVVTIQTKQ